MSLRPLLTGCSLSLRWQRHKGRWKKNKRTDQPKQGSLTIAVLVTAARLRMLLNVK
jgi:hypothetical protein